MDILMQSILTVIYFCDSKVKLRAKSTLGRQLKFSLTNLLFILVCKTYTQTLRGGDLDMHLRLSTEINNYQ